MDFGLVLIGVVALAAVVAVLYLLITRLTRAGFKPRRRPEAELGLEALERRLARGEITREEYEQVRRALGV